MEEDQERGEEEENEDQIISGGLHISKIIYLRIHNRRKVLTHLYDANFIASLSVFVFWVECQLFFQILWRMKYISGDRLRIKIVLPVIIGDI